MLSSRLDRVVDDRTNRTLTHPYNARERGCQLVGESDSLRRSKAGAIRLAAGGAGTLVGTGVPSAARQCSSFHSRSLVAQAQGDRPSHRLPVA
ncbi:hypothetical protein [Microcoleus sp. N9_A1]|uniref:hypothetical protein n=1 Tax=Microcoleus sp. N9_A1 TaxID=3055380 RepID=UPI002FCEE335